MIILSETHPPVEGVVHTQADTAAVVGEGNFGVGKLYISESMLTWISNDGRGFSLSYPSISMHAISRDVRNFPQPCIYMVIDAVEEKKWSGRETNAHVAEKLAACSLKTDLAKPAIPASTAAAGAEGGGENGSGNAETDDDHGDDDHEDEETKSAEIRFVPADGSSLEAVYNALSECQALHPDENDSLLGGSSDDEPYMDDPDSSCGDVQFDNNGQLAIYQMRGVRRDGEELMEDASSHQQESEDMETEQFEGAPQ